MFDNDNESRYEGWYDRSLIIMWSMIMMWFHAGQSSQDAGISTLCLHRLQHRNESPHCTYPFGESNLVPNVGLCCFLPKKIVSPCQFYPPPDKLSEYDARSYTSASPGTSVRSRMWKSRRCPHYGATPRSKPVQIFRADHVFQLQLQDGSPRHIDLLVKVPNSPLMDFVAFSQRKTLTSSSLDLQSGNQSLQGQTKVRADLHTARCRLIMKGRFFGGYACICSRRSFWQVLGIIWDRHVVHASDVLLADAFQKDMILVVFPLHLYSFINMSHFVFFSNLIQTGLKWYEKRHNRYTRTSFSTGVPPCYKSFLEVTFVARCSGRDCHWRMIWLAVFLFSLQSGVNWNAKEYWPQ